jgi:hypothetical protein
MRLFLLCTLLLVCSCTFAQTKILSVSFMKNDGTYVEVKDSADYLRVVSEPDSGCLLHCLAVL